MTQIIGDFPIAGLRLFVPHSLALSPNEDTLYVADRENHRILAFGTSNKGGVEVFSSANELGRVFAVAFSGVGTGGWPMVTLNENSGEGGTAAYGLSLDSHGNPQQAWGVSQVRTYSIHCSYCRINLSTYHQEHMSRPNVS